MHADLPFWFSWPRAAAAGLTLGLHAAVVALVLAAPRASGVLPEPAGFDVQFVDLGVMASSTPASTATLAAGAASVPALPLAAAPVQQPLPAAARVPSAPVRAAPRREAASRTHRQVPAAARPALRQASSEGQPASRAGADIAGAGPAGARATAADAEPLRVVRHLEYLGARPAPVYPALSQRRGEQGRVVLRVTISPHGRAEQVRVLHSSGYARLDQAAVDAVEPARFRPYTEGSVAFSAVADIPFDFVLQAG